MIEEERARTKKMYEEDLRRQKEMRKTSLDVIIVETRMTEVIKVERCKKYPQKSLALNKF